MAARISLVALLLLILCPLGCFTLDRQHNSRHANVWRQDLKTFKTEFDYYFFSMARPEDKPQRKDRGYLSQTLRDFQAADDDWHYFVHGFERTPQADTP